VKKDIKILLVDDHHVVCEGLRRMLELEEDMQVVGECNSAEEAFSKVERLSPDIILMDIRMPTMSGIEATRRLKEKQPACQIIMLTMFGEYLAEAIEAGAVGYLLKDVKRDELVRAIRGVYHGHSPVNVSLSREMLTGFATAIKASERPDLSQRELAVLRLLASGATTKEMSAQLSLSEATIKRDVQRIFNKFGVRSRSEAVGEAYKRKLV